MLKTVSSISNVIGALNYKGAWNASSNVPVLSSGVGTKGDYYVVSTAGSTNLDGTTLWGVGDWAVFNGSIWQKVDGGDTSAVTSLTVTGLTGYMYANGSNLVTASTTIPNSGLTNSAVTIGNTSVSLGATQGTFGNVTLQNANITSVAATFPNSYLANSSITINGTSISLGGSGTISANTTGTLTLGTGLTGTSFNGSANVTTGLANTTVTAGSYGNASTVGNFTVDAQGRLTAASNSTISISVAAVSGAVPNTVNVVAGTGLTGGGALTGNVTLNLANTAVTAGSYGNASSVSTITVNAQGQLTAASNTSIAIDAGAVTTGTLAVARGGTNIASYTIGDLIYASGTTTLAKLPDVAVGSVVVSGGVGAAPTYSATPTVTTINYTTAIGGTSETVPLVIGGTTASSTLTLESTSGAGTTDAILFKTGSQSERMRIDTSGNVGIGTSSPTAKLDVLTSINLGQNFLNVGYDVGSGGGWIAGYNSTYSTSAIRTVTTGALSSIWYNSAGLLFYTNSSAAGGTAATERMRIDSSGNVGIGATANASAILDAQSTTKGVRFPNMTTTQKNAISSPAAGLVVFDTTLAKLCVYSGSAWQTITSV